MVEPKDYYVIDASVALKWVLKEEEDTVNSFKIREDILLKKAEAAVPSHFFAEILNTLGSKRPKGALIFLHQLRSYGILECAISMEIATIAIDLMQKLPKVSFYDASYHALAINLNGTFVTADENYYKKAKKFKCIKLLKEY